MSKLKLSALLLGVVLYMGFGATSLLAGPNCDSCATSAKSEKVCDKKCVKYCAKGEKCKHGDKCDCETKKPMSTMKCAAGKCGSK